MSARILIVDDVAANRIVHQAQLKAAFYEPLLAEDGEACLDALQDERPDLVLLDLGLPGISGLEVLRRMRANAATRDVPVIALTTLGNSGERLAAFAAGADDVMARPANQRLLLARVRNLLRSRPDTAFPGEGELAAGLAEAPAYFEPRAVVALVSSQPSTAGPLLQDLSERLRDRLVLLSRGEALAETAVARRGHGAPEVFIIHDDGHDPMGSLQLLSELKSHQNTRHAAVCVVGPSGEGDEAAMAFDLGADDAVGPEVTAAELALRTRGLLRRKRNGDRRRARMQDSVRLAMIDPLTGLYNRRYATPQLMAIAERSSEEGEEFAVMVVDLDHFKRVNDRFGHAVGDQVLIEVARRLQANLRESDVLARIGGEEFLVILPRCCATVARLVAGRLCQAIDERPIRLTSGEELRVTVSIGVAVAGRNLGKGGAVEGLVEQADLALMESKGAGRNKVTYRLSAA
jgi:two-component system, cell cycle response regulator